MSLAKQILDTPDETILEPVSVAGWPDVFLGEINGADIAWYYRYVNKERIDGSHPCAEAVFVAMALRDKDGNPVFQRSQYELLAAKSWRKLRPLYQQAMKLNGFGEDAIETAKKNSATTPGGSPSGDLPSGSG